ncbi:hypothetical protein ACTFIZ_007788 [Dictyostelium cf. discoideum]
MIPIKNNNNNKNPTQQNKQKQDKQQQQQTKNEYKKIFKKTITLNRFLIITSLVLVLCLFLFNSQITRILSSSTPVFYSKFYLPIQSQFSKFKSETTIKIENEGQQLKEKGKEKKEQLKDKSNKIIDDIKEKKDQYKDKLEQDLKDRKETFNQERNKHQHNLNEEVDDLSNEFKEKKEQLKQDSKSKFEKVKEKSKDLKENIKSKSHDLKDNLNNAKEESEKVIEHTKDVMGDLKMKLMETFDFSNFAKLKDLGITVLNKLNIGDGGDDSGGGGGGDGKWNNFQFGSFVAEQGTLSKEDGYIRLESNPFTSTTQLSVLDHIKYLAVSNQVFSIPQGGSLFSNFSIRGKAFGNKNHPFPLDLVQQNDIESEIRFASGSLNVLDFKTSIVADFMVSNSKLYALYERLPFSRGEELGNYAAFVYTIPVADIKDQLKFIDVSVEYNSEKKSIHWYLHDKEVFKVDQVGHFSQLIKNQQLNERGGSLIMSKGGVETLTFPAGVQVCFGVFSLLDATISGKNMALVRLDDPSNKYYDPTNLEKELKFHDEKSILENRIFGQGFILDIQKISISSKQ